MLRSMRSTLSMGAMARAAFRQSAANAAARAAPVVALSRGNATAAAPAGGAGPKAKHVEAKKEAKAQYVTLQEIDRLLTHISRESQPQESSKKAKDDTPLVMRAHPVPWMKPEYITPELSGSPKKEVVPLSPEEKEQLLAPKHMSASYTSFVLPLASNPRLYDKYVNFAGGFRMGKILEHLDSLAGAVGYRHCLARDDRDASEDFHNQSSRAGIFIATASADRLDMFGSLNHENVRDLKFSGFVTWTGRSSMEVFAKLEGMRPGSTETDTLMLGRFSMVCRDSHTYKAHPVPPLIVETPEEQALWDIGQAHKEERGRLSKLTLDKQAPSGAESTDLHTFMLATRGRKEIDGKQIIKMKDTEMSSVQIMFPQERNLHGNVFGGFLMRQAFELAFTNAAVFAQKPTRFLALDKIEFKLPVPIGSILWLKSKIVYCEEPTGGAYGEGKIHIIVKAEVEDVSTGTRNETNTFFFTMVKDNMEPLRKIVVPDSYVESMQYLEGERRIDVGDEVRRLYRAGVH